MAAPGGGGAQGVFIVDDGIGQCGERIAATVAGQFPSSLIRLEIFAHVRDPDQVRPIVEEARRAGAVLVHTLVVPPVLATLYDLAAEHEVPVVDLVTDLLALLESSTGTPPVRVPGLYHHIQEKHFQFCGALRYTLNHDDGMAPESWDAADMLILGVSRVGKTPLSVFMATLGYQVANCPLVPGQALPPALEAVDRRRIFGLTMEPDVLATYRECRQRATWRGPCGLDAYTNLKTVWQEVEEAERRFKQLKVLKVDVTHASVQCIANKLIGLLKDRLEGEADVVTTSPVPWNYAPKTFDIFAPPTERRVNVFLVTTGIGYSGERMVNAVCSQFPRAYIRIEVYGHVTETRLPWVIGEVVRLGGGIVVHSMVVASARSRLVELAGEHGIPCVDLVGPFLEVLATRLGRPSIEQPGVYQRSDELYFQFARAVEFAMEHDDGANPDGWVHADALLLGVSRVGKSPLSIFLGTLGLKAANYPLCPGVEFPAQLDKVDRRRVFGLVVDAEVLAEHRNDRRAIAQYGGQPAYSALRQVMGELEAVEDMFKRRRISVINVTGMPMESVADRIVKTLGDRFGDIFDEAQASKRYQPL